jgi:hypothetical protein
MNKKIGGNEAEVSGFYFVSLISCVLVSSWDRKKGVQLQDEFNLNTTKQSINKRSCFSQNQKSYNSSEEETGLQDVESLLNTRLCPCHISSSSSSNGSVAEEARTSTR